MNSAIERLLSLRVQDVMSDSPVQLNVTGSMSEAAKTLQRHSISGAPVADDRGQCVGMLTAVDFITHMLTAPSPVSSSASTAEVSGTTVEEETVLVQDAPGEPYHVEMLGSDIVQNFMTPNVKSIAATMPIMEAARAMCGSHIHRLVVLDEQGRSIGMVSSIDLVAAMVKAVEE